MTPSTDDARSDAGFESLALSDERGGAVLVCGGSASARRLRVDQVVAGVNGVSSPGPLVARLSPCEGERTLVDAIDAAVEAELTRLRAPGGLADDPSGGALASLGGWLFRARAVERRGVLLVVDDVDAWLDARGTASDARRALATLKGALDECRRRPLAVLASVRAADAGGEPALPGGVVAAFGRVERLGGAQTVTRDPMALVTQLAGRGFTLGTLKHALAGWLEVPAYDDDTVVVFSSPLAPTALGLEPAAPEVALELGPREVSPGNPREPAATTLGDGWSDAVGAAVEVREALRALSGLETRHGAHQWERMFCDGASRLANELAVLERGEKALGLPGTRVSRRGREAMDRFDSAFPEYYAHAYDAWLAGTVRPTMLCDLPARLTRLATERGARGTAFVVLTGLRIDAWKRLRQRVLPRVAGLVLVEEGVHWAARPATPRTQRELLARGLAALGASLPPRDEPAAPRTAEEALTPRREHLGRHEVLRIDAYAFDAAQPWVPGARLDAGWEVIERALAPVLLALCGSFAGRTALVLAGDAGLREQRATAREAPTPRGVGGGDSAFEVLVPYALFMWG